MTLSILYDILLTLVLVLTLPVWVVWLAAVPKMRAGLVEKLGWWPRELKERVAALPKDNRVWIHCVSVGELNAAKPLIKALREQGLPLVLSATTATGYKLAGEIWPELPRVYFPLDLRWPMTKAMDRIAPRLILVLETEIWPNLQYTAERRGVPVLLVNGRLSPRSFQGYRRFKGFFGSILNRYSQLLMQSEGDAERMLALGVDPEKVRSMGNLKYDLPPFVPSERLEALRTGFAFPPEAPVVVFASSHKGEEEQFLEAFEALRASFPELRAVLAPRHPERADTVAELIAGRGLEYRRRSALSPESPNPPESRIILLDTIGELMDVFALGSVACMGGSFVPVGGHNPLEPINAHCPVIFGPHMENFKDMTGKVTHAKAGLQVTSLQGAIQAMHRVLSDRAFADQLKANGDKLLAENRGAVTGIVGVINGMLSAPRR